MPEKMFDILLNAFVWKLNGEIHRDGDEPAVELADGTKYWYKNGQLHRDGDQPAIEGIIGDKWWFKNGQLHRDEDKPAIEIGIYEKWWFQRGKIHRDADNPAVEFLEGKWWYQNGKRHRDGDKPAIERIDGTVEYWTFGEVIPKIPKTSDMIGAVCVITLEPIYNDAKCGFCTTCRKTISYDALREWLKYNNSCPHCRSEWTNNVVYK